MQGWGHRARFARRGLTVCALLSLCICPVAYAADEPEGLRDRFLARLKADLNRLPDFVCLQTADRFQRTSAERAWEKIDTVRFEVALVGNEELYALPGQHRFRIPSLGGYVAQGSISTGQLALLAKHVFLTSTADLTYRGESEQGGRRAYEYAYDVPSAQSGYHLSLGKSDAVVAFQGSFWIDAETLDLLRLEVQAYDIPESLGLAEADTALDYSRVDIDGVDVLLARAGTLTVTATNGDENLNRTALSECKHYRSESTIQFAAGEGAASGVPDRAAPTKIELPAGAVLDLILDSSLDPATAKIGDTIKAILEHPVKASGGIVVPQGAAASGRVVRLDKMSMPFPIYKVGLEFENLTIGDQVVPLAATMDEAGPAAGLLRQSKHLDPVFTPGQRSSHIDVLVREVQRGQGILDWDAKRTPIPRGLRMKWRVQPQ
jgi:hypothetical protein